MEEKRKAIAKVALRDKDTEDPGTGNGLKPNQRSKVNKCKRLVRNPQKTKNTPIHENHSEPNTHTRNIGSEVLPSKICSGDNLRTDSNWINKSNSMMEVDPPSLVKNIKTLHPSSKLDSTPKPLTTEDIINKTRGSSTYRKSQVRHPKRSLDQNPILESSKPSDNNQLRAPSGEVLERIGVGRDSAVINRLQKSNGFSLYSFKNSIEFAKDFDLRLASSSLLARSKSTSPLQLPFIMAAPPTNDPKQTVTSQPSTNPLKNFPDLLITEERTPVKKETPGEKTVDTETPTRRPKQDNQTPSVRSTNSDEILCKVFSVDKSVTLTSKANNSHQDFESKELKEYLDKSIRNEANRTLSFLNEDNDQSKSVKDTLSEVSVKKKLRLSKPLVLQKKEVRPTESKSAFLYFNTLQDCRGLNQSYQDVSLFSTQDSGPSKSKCLHPEHSQLPVQEMQFSDQKYVRASPAPLTNQSVFSEEKVFNGYPQQDLYPSQLPGYLSNYPFPKQMFLQMQPGLEDELLKKSRIRKSHPIFNSKEFDIVPNRIFQLRKTTLMIKNIPNRYTKEMMLEMIDRQFRDTYNFFYLPIDFDNSCNVGYAFINFIDLETILPFYNEFNGNTWPHFKSDKIAEITYARIQGRDACIQHFKDSSLMKQQVDLSEHRRKALHQVRLQHHSPIGQQAETGDQRSLQRKRLVLIFSFIFNKRKLTFFKRI